jgi:hypothetical protein
LNTQLASDEYYDAEADEDDVQTEVTTGDGKTHKNTLPPKSTVLVLKQRLAHDAGYKPGQTRMFVNGDSREEELEEEEGLGSLRRGKGLAVMITMTVEEADAQEVVPRLAAKADLVLGEGTAGNNDGQLITPRSIRASASGLGRDDGDKRPSCQDQQHLHMCTHLQVWRRRPLTSPGRPVRYAMGSRRHLRQLLRHHHRL